MIAAPRSTPAIERPEPLPSPVCGSSAITSAGRPVRSLIRPATMPITPGCHPVPASTGTRAVVLPGKLRFGLDLHLGLDRAAFLVQFGQADGDVARPRPDRSSSAG